MKIKSNKVQKTIAILFLCLVMVFCLLQYKSKINSYENKIQTINTQLEKVTNASKNKDNQIKKLNKQIDGLEKQVKELTTKKQQEQKREQEQLSNKGEEIQMTLTFYGDFAHENGGYEGIDAQGNPLRNGTVASNVYDFGTQFEYNGNTYTVNDRGGASHFDNPNRLDVFVGRNGGESDSHYEQRISNMGKQTVVMYKK